MKNVTISMDEKLASWVRIRAAEEGISVSRLLAQHLESMKRRDSTYASAKKRFLARSPLPLRRKSQRLPSREELHER